MHKRGLIQSVFGWVLLIIFSFSITPKQLLHDILAHHTDLVTEAPSGKSASISKTGFSCDRLNLVAESPFVEVDEFTESIPAQDCTDFIVSSHHAAAHKAVILSSLRGPPCI
jgi:hypothetical protein